MANLESNTRVTMTIPEAAAKLGVARNQGYEAAKRGEIPTIRIGRRVLVPLVAFARLLAGDAPEDRLDQGLADDIDRQRGRVDAVPDLKHFPEDLLRNIESLLEILQKVKTSESERI